MALKKKKVEEKLNKLDIKLNNFEAKLQRKFGI